MGCEVWMVGILCAWTNDISIKQVDSTKSSKACECIDVNPKQRLTCKETLLMVERTCRSMKKVGNGKRPTAWLVLQPDLVIFLLSRNLIKSCMVELVSRAPHRAVADYMARVTRIETEPIVTTMLALGIS